MRTGTEIVNPCIRSSCVSSHGKVSIYMSPISWEITAASKTERISTIGLIGHNKRFLYLTTGAPGSTHDARLLRHTTIFHPIENYVDIPNKTIDLGEAGEIPLITPGDSAFSSLTWLIKGFNKNTCDSKERYLNKEMHFASTLCIHTLCIHTDDPCKSSWKISVENLELLINQFVIKKVEILNS